MFAQIPTVFKKSKKPVCDFQVSEEQRNMMIPLTNFGIKCMSMGFLVKPENSVVWRGPMVMGAIERMIHGTLWYVWSTSIQSPISHKL